ncbi:MAG: isoprenylcysteine carboxylmethyltransferase family protein [Candidatus Kapabacteria bacterium]|jgi:protein-S-isoprenylcysteine O-methyltransferase Ste14|nr:isoprenylcysteine carboxylmethyltransferase family protein [Candidatus Kapabacteria bacterium]
MAMIEEFERSGNWLFKRRSFLPIVIFVMLPLAVWFDPGSLIRFPEMQLAIFGLIVSFLGLVVRSYAVGFSAKYTSGRNRSGQVAGSVNKKGIYSIVRHPLYLGNFLMWLGLIIYTGMIWFILFVVLIFWVYYERIMFAEESFLRGKFKEDYSEWADRTPCFIPNFGLWDKTDSGFSFKKVIKNEIYGFVVIAVSVLYINAMRNYVATGNISADMHWLIFAGVSFVLLIIIRYLKKNTNVFDNQKSK